MNCPQCDTPMGPVFCPKCGTVNPGYVDDGMEEVNREWQRDQAELEAQEYHTRTLE
jgi:uncharacterized Zn finger protein (UPF0148 family)